MLSTPPTTHASSTSQNPVSSCATECGERKIPLDRSAISPQGTFSCPHCKGMIYLTDVLRLHEAIDDELGAGEILGYVATAVEQLLMVHNMRTILEDLKPAMFHQVLFIKDGPLAFFGQTSNMHKPMLAQHAAMLVKLDHGNAEWIRDKFPLLQAFERKYREEQFHAPTGLYFWKDDLAIGVDNDPSTFFRPFNSSGSIFLNCLMYKELLAMAYLSKSLQLGTDVTTEYEQQADALKAAIQKNCWDERDGYFYSVDLNLRPITNEAGDYLDSHFVLHKNHPRDYDCLIERIEGWSGFMAMWSGVATQEQARRMVEERLKNTKTLGARFGIRTLSKMEKMYGLYASNNPSNWNGPIWGISNYVVFRGLVKYGFEAEARERQMPPETRRMVIAELRARGDEGSLKLAAEPEKESGASSKDLLEIDRSGLGSLGLIG